MTSYSVSCGVHATDNDYFKMVELYLTGAYIPQFITGLRALITGKIDVLRLSDGRRKAVITNSGGIAFKMLFENGSIAYLCEEHLYEMESFVLDRMLEQKKPGTCLSLQLDGQSDLQLSFSLWVDAG